MLIFYSSYRFLSSSYLFFPVSQMNVDEIKCILKCCCEVFTICSSSDNLLGGFFLVCSSVGTGKEKNVFQCYFVASFPLPDPWSRSVFCFLPCFSFSLGLTLLPFMMVLQQCQQADFGVLTLISGYLPHINGCGKSSTLQIRA